jgi:hypothetical protein
VRESKVERYLTARVKWRGGRCLKFVSPGRRGVVDRLVQWPATGPYGILPIARTHYVETKAPGKKLVKGGPQDRERKWLKTGGFDYFLLDTIEKVDAYITRYA